MVKSIKNELRAKKADILSAAHGKGMTMVDVLQAIRTEEVKNVYQSMKNRDTVKQVTVAFVAILAIVLGVVFAPAGAGLGLSAGVYYMLAAGGVAGLSWTAKSGLNCFREKPLETFAELPVVGAENPVVNSEAPSGTGVAEPVAQPVVEEPVMEEPVVEGRQTPEEIANALRNALRQIEAQQAQQAHGQ